MIRNRKTLVVLLCMASVCALTMAAHTVSWCTTAGEPKVVFELKVDSENAARVVFSSYCGSCHQQGRSGIDFDDEHLTLESMQQNRATWNEVARRLRTREMPPRKSPQPTENERLAMIAWIDKEVLQKTTDSSKGRLMARRLDHSEYANSIRDLVGVRVQPPSEFPKDAQVWTRCDEVPAISPEHLAIYRTAAKQAVDQAFAAATKDVPVSTEDESAGPRRKLRQPVLDLRQTEDAGDHHSVDRTREILRRFVARAYRKPADACEIDHLVAVFQAEVKDGKSFDDSLKPALIEVLTSPSFLMRVERRGSAGDGLESDQFDLASRLAFFLWRTGPDEELLELAEQGLLEDNLETQVTRMLKSRSARGFAKDFANSWLSLSKLDSAMVPDEPLRQAMRLETERFVESIVCDDRNVLEFIDADYTFVNERLAKHYGLTDVTGTQMRRVSVKGTPRGGLVAQAALLRINSTDLRTSPVNRGKWVLETLLGAAPIRPPAGILQALEATSSKTDRGSLTQQLALHRENPSCAGCHHKMDAIGLSLENFNSLGAFNRYDEGQLIEAIGTLPDGEILDGPTALKRYLLTQHDQFVRALGERVLQFSLGRKLEDRDRAALSGLPAAVAADQNRFSRVIMQVVLSEPFRRGFAAND